jgi:hypothetical protein
MNQSVNTSTFISLLTQLPRELIYKIAATNSTVYNTLLRLCHTITSLFPLSTRLNIMIDFGIHVEIKNDYTGWYWNGRSHDVWGPADTYDDGSASYYYRGLLHRVDKPAGIWPEMISWYTYGSRHRDRTAPSGTGVGWLDGVALIIDNNEYIEVERWHLDYYICRSEYLAGSIEYTQARAEMDYWLARERR